MDAGRIDLHQRQMGIFMARHIGPATFADGPKPATFRFTQPQPRDQTTAQGRAIARFRNHRTFAQNSLDLECALNRTAVVPKAVDGDAMKIGELARHSGLTTHTIRYYERIGLLPPADRHSSGIRDYDAQILVWIGFLRRLKTTGMSLRDMRAYAALRTAGSDTRGERHDLLVRHQLKVRAQIDDLNAALVALDTKIASYTNVDQRSQSHDG
jgi:DNA-binding transcriptional MerR regulator